MKKLVLKAVNKEAVTSKETLQQGRLAVVNSQAGTKYQVMDEATGLPAKGQVLKKKGKDLIVSVDGEEAAVIHDFYADVPTGDAPTYQASEASAAGGESAAGESVSAGDSGVITGGSSGGVSDGIVWNSGTDGAFQVASAADALGAEEGLTTAQMAGLGLGSLAAGGGAAAIAAGGGAAAATAATATGGTAVVTTVAGSFVAGPVLTGQGLQIEIYNADGTKLLGSGVVKPDGTFSVDVGDYTGVVIAKLIDTNGNEPDYMDEATNAGKDVNAEFMAVGTVTSGGAITLNINALTTVAAVKAGVNESAALSEDAVNSANSDVASAFGLVSLSDPVEAVITTNGDPNADANLYGKILAAFSGADKNNGGDAQSTIDAIAADLDSGNALTNVGKALLFSGAGVVDPDLSRGVLTQLIEAFGTEWQAGTFEISADTGTAGDFLTNQASQTISGTLSAALGTDEQVMVSVNGTDWVAATVVDTNGVLTWSLSNQTLREGLNIVQAQVVDVNGNFVTSGSYAVTLDRTAPTQTTTVAISNDTGTSSSDYLTNQASQIISGTLSAALEPGDRVMVSLNGGNNWEEATVTGTAWSLAGQTLVTGENQRIQVKIEDAAGNESTVVSQAYTLDTTASTIESVLIQSATGAEVDSGGVYHLSAGDVVSVKVVMSEVVNVTGTPQLELMIGTTKVLANYASGTGSKELVFTYTIAEGQTDTDGISVEPGSLILNSGTIQDVAGTNATLTHESAAADAKYVVDAVAAQVADTVLSYTGGVEVPGANAGETVTYLNAGDKISVTVTMDETVVVDATNGTPRIKLSIGGVADGTEIYADYDAVATAALNDATKTKFVFTYTIAENLTDLGSISVVANTLELNSGVIKDAAGNAATLAHAAVEAGAAYQVDTTASTIESVSILSATGAEVDSGINYLSVGDKVNVSVTMSENVIVTGSPTLKLNIGGVQVDATYVSGSSSKDLVFSYTIAAGQMDANGISIDAGSLALNGGSIKDTANNAATLTHSGATANANYVVDTVAAQVSSTVLSYEGGIQAEGDTVTYLNAGDKISVTVSMDEAVIVDTTGGKPQIQLSIGGTQVGTKIYAVYDATATAALGDGSKLVFTYTIDAGLTDLGSISVAANALEVPTGSSIKDAAGNDANLVHDEVAADTTYQVDTTVGSSLTAALSNDTGASANDRITSDGTVTVTGMDADIAKWEYSTTGVDGFWQDGNGSSFVLRAGTYADGAVQVRQTDRAGNVSDPFSLGGAITVDTTSSSLENEVGGNLVYVASNYTDGPTPQTVTNLDVRSPIVLDFDESISVKLGTSITLKYTNTTPLFEATFGSDGKIYDTVDTTLEIGTYSVGAAADSDKLTIQWNANFDLGTGYTLEIGAGAVTNLAGKVNEDVISVQFSTVDATSFGASTDFTLPQPPQLQSSGKMNDAAVAPEWFEITSYGTSYTLDDTKSYVIVLKDSSTEDWDTNVKLTGSPTELIHITNFGDDDLIYFDSAEGHIPMTFADFVATAYGMQPVDMNDGTSMMYIPDYKDVNDVVQGTGVTIVFDGLMYTNGTENWTHEYVVMG